MADPENSIKTNGRQDDRLWKAVLEHVFRHFLLFFFPASKDLFDFRRGFVYLDKEMDELFPEHRQGGNKGVRYVDKLVKVFLKDGGERFILTHVEVQSQKGKGDLARRMADYYIKLREKYKVPITAVAILGDGNKNYRPSGYEEGLLGTKLTYEFTSYKILDQDEAALRADRNPFSVVVLTALMAIRRKGVDDDTLRGIKRDLYFEMKGRKMPKHTRAGIYDFLKYYVSFVDPNQFIIFESETSEIEGRSTEAMGTTEYLLDKAEKQGIQKGMEKGEETKSYKVVANLIQQLGLDDQAAAGVAEVSTDFVQKVRLALQKKK
ncbi:hypothetical protein [Parapedobacter tibetensis]|uniref:hypothetical protein n=1 Tax=Parapedobacter tibetensis TaxID=2972951 RepID=UPI00214D5D6A|nr:hypothetical protein [Parapedobacter tibetensis]